MNSLWGNLRQANDRGLFQNSYVPIKGKVYFVNPDDGSDYSSGNSWDQAFASMSPLDNILTHYDVICLTGVLRQQWTAPSGIKDVTIIGMANRPRQATSDGVAEGGGATWLAPTSPTATTPLLSIRGNGWKVDNLFFGAHTDDAAIKLNTGSGIESGHCSITNCHFSAGLIGIEDAGGTGFVYIANNRFYGQTGSGGSSIQCTSTSNAVPLRWLVENNIFMANQSNFLASMSYAVIRGNTFGVGSASNINTTHNSGQGGNNHVIGNYFHIAANDFDPAGGVTGASTDFWSNWLNNNVELGGPAN